MLTTYGDHHSWPRQWGTLSNLDSPPSPVYVQMSVRMCGDIKGGGQEQGVTTVQTRSRQAEEVCAQCPGVLLRQQHRTRHQKSQNFSFFKTINSAFPVQLHSLH